MRNQKEPNLKHPHLNSSLPSSKACSNNFLVRSKLQNSAGHWLLTRQRTKRRVMTASFRLLLCLTSASVNTSPAPENTRNITSCTCKLETVINVPNLPKLNTIMLRTWRNFHVNTCQSANNLLFRRKVPHTKLGSRTVRNTAYHLLRAINRLSGRIKHWNRKAPWCRLHV